MSVTLPPSGAGITRERLESLDRKITCEPEDYPDKRDGLIADFQNYLSIIKSVHEGADLQVHPTGFQDSRVYHCMVLASVLYTAERRDNAGISWRATVSGMDRHFETGRLQEPCSHEFAILC